MTARTTLILVLLCVAGRLSAAGVTLPAAERIVLDNGTVLILNEKRDVPMVGIQAMLRGGAVTDPDGKSGLSSLYASLLEKGAGDRDAAAFAEAVAAVGGNLSAGAALESISISGDFLARDAGLMVELLADMLRRPKLDRAELDKLKRRSINLLLAAKDGDPRNLVPVYANAFLFGDHPYGSPTDGSEASLATITARDIARYHEQQVGGDRLVIAVSGYFDIAAMRERLTAAFGDWRPASAELPDLAAPERVAGNRVLLVNKPGATQTYFWIGNIGVAFDYPERAALDLANTVFGGRFTSLLNTALRVESGLTYSASSALRRPSKPGSVAISSYTQTDATVEAIDMALDVLDRFRADGVPADAAASARNYLLGRFPTQLETATQLAAQFATLELYGLGRDYIDAYGDAVAAVTPESVKLVINAVYPARDDLVFVLLGDAEAIRDTIVRYGSVTELSITEPRFLPQE